MKQLNKFQSIIFLMGGVLMVVGAGAFVFMWHQKLACWVFLLGAIFFTLMQSMQLYEGKSIVIRRLKRIQSLSDIFFLLSAILMVDSQYQFIMSIFSNYVTYLSYVYNKWVVLLLIAAVLEMYTTHRIASELNREKQDN